MLCWNAIFGGLLTMMGQHERSEALFYYLRLEDQIPENHLLRLIDKHGIYQQLTKLRPQFEPQTTSGLPTDRTEPVHILSPALHRL